MLGAMKRYLSLLLPAAALLLGYLLGQAGPREDAFVMGTPDQQRSLRTFFHLLNKEPQVGARRFTLLQKITDQLRAQNQIDKINLLLTTYVQENPTDPFDAHYLYEVAENYQSAGATPFARHYYRLIVNAVPDLVEDGDSLQYRSLVKLTELETDPSTQREVFQRLDARFRYKMVTPALFYNWGRADEALGRWDEAQKAYDAFLKFPDPVVPGHPKAASRVHSLHDLAQTDRSWIDPDLNHLISRVEYAIQTDNTRALETLRAKVGFFAVSWDNADVTDTLSEAFDIRQFLSELVRQVSYNGRSDVRFSPALDEMSNENEAYLRSVGWNFRIPTWYFYFRRVDYPADPDINGAWEWAGLYFGEKL